MSAAKSRRWKFVARGLCVCLAVCTSLRSAHAQGTNSWTADQVPRFILARADSTVPPVVLDPAQVPSLRKRLSLHLRGETLRSALNAIARQSGLQLVYALDVMPLEDTVHLQADDITVAAALTEVLLGHGVDVVMGTDGNVILVRKSAIVVAAPKRDVIRGVVTSSTHRPIPGAEVIATMAPDRQTFRANTDSAGRYQIVVSPSTGDFLVYISAPGHLSFRKRVTSGAADTVFVVDAVLETGVQTLAAVRTTARRVPPPRDDISGSMVGTGFTEGVSVTGALSPDQAGDLNALASLLPGVLTGPDGSLSFGGVDGSQNKAFLNGLEFDGSKLPRGLQTRTQIGASVFDPTRGGFGGGYLSASINQGGYLRTSYGYLSLDAPALQGADASSGELGHRFTGVDASYANSGELVQDTWVYNAGVEFRRHSSDAPSIFTVDPATLARLGVASDSANAFVSALARAGVPTRLGGIPAEIATNTIDLAFRLDRSYTTHLFNFSGDTRPQLGFVGSAVLSTSDPTGASAFAPPSHDGHLSSGSLSLQFNASRYLGDSATTLEEFATGATYGFQRADPYMQLPGGSVLTTSMLPDGTTGLAQLQFGGASLAARSETWRWEATNGLTFSPASMPNHRLKFYGQFQFDGYAQESDPNALGTFRYNSLADFEANAPSTFSRTLLAPGREGGEISGALAISDYWTPTPNLRLVLGPRADWTSFATNIADNPEVARVLGVENGFSPTLLDVSPRAGFTWLIHGLARSGAGTTFSPLGTNAVPPKGVLRGGIGEFRSTPSPTLLSDAAASTGLAGTSISQLSCIGSAVPTPNWQAYLSDPASIPSACANGAGPGGFSDAAAPVRAIDRSYAAPRRWTGDLTWTSATKFLSYSIHGQYHIALDQPGVTDANFGGSQQFVLANEGNRPVYVSPANIVPSSGLIATSTGRTSAEFGQVLSARSDARRDTRQVTLTLQPLLRLPTGNGPSMFLGSVSYTYTDSRALLTGFDANTFGDPRLSAWAFGGLPRHQVQAQGGVYITRLKLAITASLGLQSGSSYTPMVSGDINGDGMSNDRAFVFDPASAPADVAAGMRSLLATAPPDARDCLQRQLGAVAGRNSCELPWTVASNLRIDWNRNIGDQDNYAKISINVSNPAAGLDQLLHGASGLHGWGAPVFPDPNLLYVTGFDPNARQFQYQVNQRFGNTRPNVLQLYNPFRVTIDVTLRLAPNVREQTAHYYVRPTRSAPDVPPPADTILARIRNQRISIPSPYAPLLALADSLLLSADQVRALTAASQRLRARVDSAQKVNAAELAAMAKTGNADAIMRRVQVMQGGLADIDTDYALIGTILTPTQRRLLPVFVAREVDAALKKRKP